MAEYDPNQPVLGQMNQNFSHPYPGPEGDDGEHHQLLEPRDTHGRLIPPEGISGIIDARMSSPAYRQGREALRVSRIVRPGLKEQP